MGAGGGDEPDRRRTDDRLGASYANARSGCEVGGVIRLGAASAEPPSPTGSQREVPAGCEAKSEEEDRRLATPSHETQTEPERRR
jgi:hypothetical protein